MRFTAKAQRTQRILFFPGKPDARTFPFGREYPVCNALSFPLYHPAKQGSDARSPKYRTSA